MPSPWSRVTPTGVWMSSNPKTIPPATIATTVTVTSAPTDRTSAAYHFCRSSRIRGTGVASVYRSEPHCASLATVSPKNSA